MSVAKCFGLDDVDGPAMRAAAVAWQRWCFKDPELAVVDDLLELADWTRVAEPRAKDALLARLHEMAVHDPEAAVVVAWLLLPGACKLASKLTDVSAEIDALVAGALWIRVRTQPADRYVAATILRDVRRVLLIDLGIGAAARRSDPVWSRTTTYDDIQRLEQADQLDVCAESESGFLIQAAVLNGAITSTEAGLLLALAQEATAFGTPARRGRAGLTAPSVINAATAPWSRSSRSVRRHVTDIATRLADFARVDDVDGDLHDFVETHDLPPVELAEFLELYLWDHIEEHVSDLHRDAPA